MELNKTVRTGSSPLKSYLYVDNKKKIRLKFYMRVWHLLS